MNENKKEVQHPGSFLRKEIIKPKQLNVTKTAKLLGISREYLSNIMHGQRDMTYGMCAKIEILFGQNAEIWATRQMLYDLDKARKNVENLNLRPYNPDSE